MKTLSEIVSIFPHNEKRKLSGISLLVLTIMIPVVFNSCQKNNGPS